jgi:hypothetical protein
VHGDASLCVEFDRLSSRIMVFNAEARAGRRSLHRQAGLWPGAGGLFAFFDSGVA